MRGYPLPAGEVLGVAGGDAAAGLADQGAVAVVAVAAALRTGGACGQPSQGVVTVGAGPVPGEVAGGVVGAAHHLVGRVVAVLLGGCAVRGRLGAVAGHVVLVGVGGARRLHSADQPLQAVVGERAYRRRGGSGVGTGACGWVDLAGKWTVYSAALATEPCPTNAIGSVLRAYVYAPDFHFARTSVSRAGKQVTIRTKGYR